MALCFYDHKHLCRVCVQSQDHPNATSGGRVARESRFLLSDVTSPRRYTAASSTSLLHEPSSPLAFRRASGPACRVLRMRVGREDQFSLLGNPERLVVSGRELEVSVWPAFSVFAGLPRAQERRRVPAQHKGVPQGLHIIPRRGRRPFSSYFTLPTLRFELCSAAYTTPRKAFRHLGVLFSLAEYRRRGTRTNKQ